MMLHELLSGVISSLEPGQLKVDPRQVDPHAPCCEKADAKTWRACHLCGAASCNYCRGLYNGYWICTYCRDELKAKIAAQTAGKQDFPAAMIGGFCAAILAGFAWGAIAGLTGFVLHLLSIAVGVATGFGALAGSGFKRGAPVQYAALICAILGILIGRYVTVVYLYERTQSVRVSFFDFNFIRFYIANLPQMIEIWDFLACTLALSVSWIVPMKRVIAVR